MKTIALTGCDLTIKQVVEVATQYTEISIAKEAYQQVEAAYDFIQHQVAAEAVIYGVTTGFGQNADKVMKDPVSALALQRNLILSHATGMGDPLPEDVVRALMVIRLNTLLAGHSGISKQTVRLLQQLINKRIHPVIPAQGSVGASGDLCPLSHMALALIGEGEVDAYIPDATGRGQQVRMKAQDALAHYQLMPVELTYKEGLALINGTTLMAALGAIAYSKAKALHKLSMACTTLLCEALCARKAAFDERIHLVRRHKQQIKVAAQISEWLEGSTMFGIAPEFSSDAMEGIQGEDWLGRQACEKFVARKKITQDAYSVRCSPQVLGGSLQVMRHVKEVVSNELNAVVDNPIIFLLPDGGGDVLSGGNFHGQPIALALDYLKIGLAEMGNLLERQINKLMDPATNDSLPAFLAVDTGLHSGLMITQYTAAALVSENKVLTHPASTDSIPTSANQEDHVSMGPIAGRQALEILGNVEKVALIHLLCSTQALELRMRQLDAWGIQSNPSAFSAMLLKKVRSLVPFMEVDRLIYDDLQALMAGKGEIYGQI